MIVTAGGRLSRAFGASESHGTVPVPGLRWAAAPWPEFELAASPSCRTGMTRMARRAGPPRH